MAPPVLSILIATFNGKGILLALIDSLYNAGIRISFEIVIMDDNSSDGTDSMVSLRFPQARMIRNHANKGYSGLNGLVGQCKGNAICILNNDMRVESDIFTPMYEYLIRNREAAMVMPTIFPESGSGECSAGSWMSRSFYVGGDIDFKTTPDRLSDSTVIPFAGVGMLLRSTLDRLGYLFDESYFILAEDVDLGLRIRLLGMRTIYLSNLPLFHRGHSTVGQKVARARYVYLCERNLIQTFLKVLSPKSILTYTPYLLFGRCLAIFRDILFLRFSVSCARIRALIWNACNLQEIFRKRTEVQLTRRVPDAFVLEVFRERYLFRRIIDILVFRFHLNRP